MIQTNKVKSTFCYIQSDYVNIHGGFLLRLIEIFDHQLWHFDDELGGGDHLIILPIYRIEKHQKKMVHDYSIWLLRSLIS
jgi:hypothetical protein